MNKFKEILRDNLTFVIIYVIALVFFIIAIAAGDYQTVTHLFKVDHYTFLNGGATGVPLAIWFVILPIVFFIASPVLKFFVPKNKMNKSATVVAGLFLLLALVSVVFLLLLVIVIPDEALPNFTQVGDAYNNMQDPYFSKTINFPFISMAISLFATALLCCYGAATCSE